MSTVDIKKMVIENFIVFHSDEADRKKLTEKLEMYMESGEEATEYNEIVNGLNLKEDSLGIHVTCQNCGASTNLN